MRAVLIAKPGSAATGVGRYAQMLLEGLGGVGLNVERVAPTLPPLPRAIYAGLRRARLDVATFLLNYPIWARYPQADVYHLTSQNLASLLIIRRPHGHVVVTVHDIIPYMLRNTPGLSPYRTVADRLFDRLALAGLRRADRLIADSHYTKRCIVQHLGIAEEKITVVHLGVDHARFCSQPVPPAIRERYALPEGPRYLIYVGSEDPRKNLPALVRTLAEVRRDLPDVELIKVGRPHFAHERRRLVELADQLGVGTAIHFLDDVPEDDLPALYNLADVCVIPSLYEGFGLPVLEAMACGTPVVCSDATSLPEVVGDAGLLVDCTGDSVADLVTAVQSVLTDPALRQELAAKGPAQAARFRWIETASEVARLYGDLGSSGSRPASRRGITEMR